jgi:hypothetical protein
MRAFRYLVNINVKKRGKGSEKGGSLVTGHWSLVTGHWSLVIGHWSLVIGHWSLVTGH